MRKAWLSLHLYLLLLVFCPQSAKAESINVVYAAADLAQAFSFVRALTDIMGTDISVRQTDVTAEDIAIAPADIYIAAGSTALQILLDRRAHSPILSIFISQPHYAALTRDTVSRVSAIYADPDPALQLKLISVLFPKNASSGVILGRETRDMISSLAYLGQKYDVDVVPQTLASSRDLGSVLNAISRTKAVLALPDESVYNTVTLPAILLTTYRHNQILIGFSPGMIKAGAAATVIHTVDHIADEAKKFLAEKHKLRSLPQPRYPSQFDVLVNERVLASLNMPNTRMSILKKLRSERK